LLLGKVQMNLTLLRSSYANTVKQDWHFLNLALAWGECQAHPRYSFPTRRGCQPQRKMRLEQQRKAQPSGSPQCFAGRARAHVLTAGMLPACLQEDRKRLEYSAGVWALVPLYRLYPLFEHCDLCSSYEEAKRTPSTG